MATQIQSAFLSKLFRVCVVKYSYKEGPDIVLRRYYTDRTLSGSEHLFLR